MKNTNINIDYKTLLFNTCSQSANLYVNKKLLVQVGFEFAIFLSFLIDKAKYHFECADERQLSQLDKEMKNQDYFYATNMDISLYTTLSTDKILALKKKGMKEGFFNVKNIGTPPKSYYKLNFEKIIATISRSEKTNELSYSKMFDGKLTDTLTEYSLEKLTIRELRFFCKKKGYTYIGDNKKHELISIILGNGSFKINKNGEKIFLKKQWTENSSIKKSIENKGKFKWTENSTINGRKTQPLMDGNPVTKNNKYNTNKYNTSKIMIHEGLDFFDKLFNEEFEIPFHYKNQESVKKLLKQFNNKQSDVVSYLRETYKNIKENSEVKNVGALFTKKIEKGERQKNPKTDIVEIETVKIEKNSKELEKELELEKQKVENQKNEEKKMKEFLYKEYYQKLEEESEEKQKIDEIIKKRYLKKTGLKKILKNCETFFNGAKKQYIEDYLYENKDEIMKKIQSNSNVYVNQDQKANQKAIDLNSIEDNIEFFKTLFEENYGYNFNRNIELCINKLLKITDREEIFTLLELIFKTTNNETEFYVSLREKTKDVFNEFSQLDNLKEIEKTQEIQEIQEKMTSDDMTQIEEISKKDYIHQRKKIKEITNYWAAALDIGYTKEQVRINFRNEIREFSKDLQEEFTKKFGRAINN